jgi:predicted lipid-binding transport protein (Tim44 family)
MSKTQTSSKLIAGALCGVLAASSAGPAAAQMPNFGAAMGGMMGGAMGAAIGSRGGAGKAMAGAIIGIAAGVILQGLIDDIERRNAKTLANSAVKSGSSSTRTFKNSQGQQVKVATRVRTTQSAEGRKCREVTTSVERDGKAESGGGTQTVCEVQLASGKTGYPTIE